MSPGGRDAGQVDDRLAPGAVRGAVVGRREGLLAGERVGVALARREQRRVVRVVDEGGKPGHELNRPAVHADLHVAAVPARLRRHPVIKADAAGRCPGGTSNAGLSRCRTAVLVAARGAGAMHAVSARRTPCRLRPGRLPDDRPVALGEVRRGALRARRPQAGRACRLLEVVREDVLRGLRVLGGQTAGGLCASSGCEARTAPAPAASQRPAWPPSPAGSRRRVIFWPGSRAGRERLEVLADQVGAGLLRAHRRGRRSRSPGTGRRSSRGTRCAPPS